MRIAIVTALAAIGCSSAPSIDNPYGEEFGEGTENPIPQQASTGPYKVATTMQFTAEALLPAQIAFIVATLREFEKDPARALLNVAEAKGVPAVGLIRDALPGVLEDKLGDWINDKVKSVELAGKPITEYAGDVARLAEFSLTEFQIDSDLAIDGYSATQTLRAIDLSPTGWTDARLPIDGLAADLLTQHPTITLGHGGVIGFGEQHFGLNYGDYAWAGIEAGSTALFGQGVKDSLHKAVDCTAVAKSVADKCVLGQCVGHESELKAICNGGLDGIVEFAKSRVIALNINVFQYAAGQARLIDDDGDGVGDRIDGGIWDANLNIGMGLRHAPATFVGER